MRPTLGPGICRWIELNLVHSDGDYLGQPFRLRPWQRGIIYAMYELDAQGNRQYDQVVLGLPKGNGKSELAAALAIAELAGPVLFDRWVKGKPVGKLRPSPDIPVSAASFEQADTVFRAARHMIADGPLASLFDVFETEIMPKAGAGKLYRVAAVAGTNDGRRPSFMVADELHEWTGKKERVHLVLSNGRAKRAGAWELSISTAGWDPTSLLGRLYRKHEQIKNGVIKDDRFLCIWYEPSKDWDLRDPEQLMQAVKEANPCADDWVPASQIARRYQDVPEHEFRRYFLNQWTTAPDRWLPDGSWDALIEPGKKILPGDEVTLGFDGSFSGDSTALVACRLADNHMELVQMWENPGDPEYRIPILEVEEAVKQAAKTYDVRALGCDPYRWQRSMAAWQEEGIQVVEWGTHRADRMVPATAQFYEAVVQKMMSHSGDAKLKEHIGNCVVKIDARGPRITKDHKGSQHHIDAAVAAVIAYDLGIRMAQTATASVYESRGMIAV